jgi:Aspartyl protease
MLRLIFTIQLVLIASAGWIDATQSSQIAEIRFRWTPGQIEIPVSVQGAPPVTFLLDTGAEFSVISTALAERLHVTTTRQGARDFADGVSLTLGAAALARGRDVRLLDQRVMVMPFDGYRQRGRDIGGLIGYDFFARYVVKIDFENTTLRIREPQSFHLPSAASSLPIEFVGRLPVMTAVLEFDSRERLDARLMVDTGASQTVILRHPFARRHQLLELGPDGPTRIAPSLASGDLKLVRLPARRLRVGSWSFDDPFVQAHRESIGSGAYTDTDGVIGNEVLRRFRLTVDYSRRMLGLEPTDRVNEPFAR